MCATAIGILASADRDPLIIALASTFRRLGPKALKGLRMEDVGSIGQLVQGLVPGGARTSRLPSP